MNFLDAFIVFTMLGMWILCNFLIAAVAKRFKFVAWILQSVGVGLFGFVVLSLVAHFIVVPAQLETEQKERAAKTNSQIWQDSLEQFSPRYGSRDGKLGRWTDSLSSTLLDAAHTTYPRPSQFVRWIRIAPADTTVGGMFMRSTLSPNISIMLIGDRDFDGEEVIETLSHEVGHFLDPRFQRQLANDRPEVAALYGPDHERKLDDFTEKFRDAYHRKGSIANSGNFELRIQQKGVQEGRTSAEAYFKQYIAEMLGCYFSYCLEHGGTLSPEENLLAKQYVEYLNGGPFDRYAAFQARDELLRLVVPLVNKIGRY